MNEDDITLLAPSQNEKAPELTLQDPRLTVQGQDPQRLNVKRTQPAPEPEEPFYGDGQDLLRQDRRRLQRDADERLMTNFLAATKADPEVAAEAHRLGLEFPELSPDIIERNVDRVREMMQRRLFAKLRSGGSRALIDTMLDPQFARIAHDDTENLGVLDMLMAQRRAGALTNERGRLADRIRQGVDVEANKARLRDVEDELKKLPAGSGGHGPMGFLYGTARTLGQMLDTLPEALAGGSSMAGAAMLLGQLGPQAGLPEELVTVPTMFGAGFFGMVAGQSAQIEAGNAYADMLDMGLSHDLASRLSVGVGIVNGLLETAGSGIVTAPFRAEAKRLLTKEAAKAILLPATKGAAKWQFVKEYLKGVGGEVATETLQEVSNIVAEEVGILLEDPSKLNLEDREGALARIGGIIAETVRGMALLGLPGPVMQLHGELNRARDAQLNEKWVEDLGKGTESSKVAKRSPRMFERFLQQLAKDTDAKSVYVNFEDFTKQMEAVGLTRKQLEELAPEVSARLGEAEQTGVVEIPTSTYGAKFLSGEFGRSLVPHLRMDPGGISPAEAAAVTQGDRDKMVEQAIKVMEDQEIATEQFKDELKQIEGDFAAQLVAAGRRPDEAATHARFYRDWVTVWAASEGMTPAQFHREYGVEFLSEQDFEAMVDGGEKPSGLSQFVATEGAANETALADLLSPVGKSVNIGPETGSIAPDGDSKVVGQFGSVRYVASVGGKPVSAVQVVTTPSGKSVISNAYTAPEARRQGHAERLMRAALRDHPDATTTGLTEAGAGLMNKATLPEGAVPNSVVEATRIENANDVALSQKWGKVRDLKVVLQKLIEKAASAAGIKLTKAELPLTKSGKPRKGSKPIQQVVESKEVEDYLVRVGVNDAVFALRQNPNAVGWYDLKTRQALRVIALIHPEVLTDADARFAFTYALAVTSNGLKVDKNFELAEVAYRAYKKTGQMPGNIGIGNAADAINKTLLAFNTLRERLGLETMRRVFLSSGTAGLFRDLTGMAVGGESVDTVVLGAAAIGPKIGNGFFANLYGMFDQLTMDRWLIRTWGRWTGTLLVDRPDMVEEKGNELAGIVASMKPDELEAFAAVLGKDGKHVSAMDPVELAALIKKASEDPGNRTLMNKTEAGSLARRTGNVLWKWTDSQKEAPSGPNERVYIRRVFGRILDEIRKTPEFAGLTMADLQAVLWYAERRIYETAKEEQIDTSVEGYDDSEAPDYAVAASKLAAANGVSERKIKNALKREEQSNGRPADARRGVPEDGAGDAAAGSGQARGLEGRDLRLVAGHAVAVDGRIARRDGQGASWGVARKAVASRGRPGVLNKALGATVVAKWVLGAKLKNRYATAGINVTELLELDPSDPQSAATFHRAISAFKERKKDHGASVYVYDEADYRGMRLILSESGKSGIAIKPDGDMVSVFSSEGNARVMVEVAVAAGATKADAFDIGLADLYAGHGFRVVSRSAWNEDYKPEGWSKDYFREFNGGEPDVVFMALDPDYHAFYAKTDGGKAVSNESAVRKQEREIKKLRAKVKQQQTGEHLNAPTELGRYYPSLRAIVLGEDANPSTVLHEMSHHFFNVMLQLAQRTGASERVRADLDTLFRWFGIAGETPEQRLGAWNSLTFEQQAPHQEQLAYNFEDYLFTGKAPTTALQKVFDKIRTWMRAAYKSVRDELNVIYRGAFGRDLPMLTPEVRQVFDRMVASAEMVEAAETMRGMLPLFQTKEQFTAAGFPEAQWDAYQETLREAREQAITDVTKASLRQMVWLRNARGRALKALQKEAEVEKDKIRAQVRAEVEQELVYLTMGLLRSSGREGKLSLEEVRASIRRVIPRPMSSIILESKKELNAQERAEKRLGTGKNGVLAKDGMSLEVAASALGYDGPDALVKALVEARPIDEEVEERVTRRMLEEHGELVDPKRREETVERALHNEARARFLAVELKFISKATKPVSVMMQAARYAASQIIGSRSLRSITPRDFSLAEARAARDADRAMKEGDSEAAIRAKQRQLLNNQLAMLAVQSKDEVRKAIAEFKRLSRSNEKLAKDYNVDLIHAARWILSQYRLLPESAADRSVDYVGMLQRLDPDLYLQILPELQRAKDSAKDWRDLTLDEFRVVTEVVKNLVFRAKRDKQVEVAGRKERLEDVVDTLVGGLEVPTTVAGERGAKSWWQRTTDKLLGTRANLTKIEHFLRWLDGGARGNFTRYLFDDVRQSLDAYRKDAALYTKKLVELVRELHAQGLLQPGEIDARADLDYVFGKGTRGNGIAELLGALLHMGNESNREKFLGAGRGDGNRWVDFTEDGELDYTRWNRFLQEMVRTGKLTKEHFRFAQQVWDLMELIKPTLQAAHRELEGYAFKEVKAQPFTIEFPDGTSETYRGGYVPAAPDRDLVRTVVDPNLDAKQNEFRQSLPKAPSGFTKERIENYRDRPLAMDVGQIAAHIDEAIRFAHVQPRVRDAMRIVTHRRFSGAMNRVDASVINDMLVPFYTRAVTQQLYKKGLDPTVDAFWKLVRRNTGVSIMFGSVVNAAQQVTGLINATLYVKPRHLKTALFDLMGRRGELANEIANLSDFMDDRLRNQMMGLTSDLRELLLDPSKSAALQKFVIEKAYFLQLMSQNVVDIITWQGAFNQAMEKALPGETGEAHQQRAIAEADSAVRMSQGSFNAEDVAPYEVSTPFGRSWTQFTSYFNTVLNQVAYAQEGQRLKAALIAFSLPMIFAQAIAMTLWQQWDDEDDDGHIDTLFDVLIGSQLRGAAGLIPAWGPAAAGLIEKVFSDKRYGDKVAASPAMTTLMRSALGALFALKAAAQGEAPTTSGVKDVLTAIVLAVPGGGLLAPAVRPAGYLLDVAAGKVEPTGPVDVGLGLLTGRASEASKR